MEIDSLGPGDVEAAMALSVQAGWNQLAGDWMRLIDLWPDFCFAGRVDGRVIATGTLAVYPPGIGWVGMILVDESQRRQGLGGRMMDHIIAVAEREGIDALGLDASELGRPVYLKKGFVERVGIDRWRRPLRKLPVASCQLLGELPVDSCQLPVSPRSAENRRVIGALAVDREWMGWDRAGLVGHLLDEPGVAAVVTDEGYVVRREGRVAAYIGPLVARSRGAAEGLLERIVAGVESSLFIDVPRGSVATDWLRGNGFEVMRELTRMDRPGGSVARPMEGTVWTAAGFELG